MDVHTLTWLLHEAIRQVAFWGVVGIVCLIALHLLSW